MKDHDPSFCDRYQIISALIIFSSLNFACQNSSTHKSSPTHSSPSPSPSVNPSPSPSPSFSLGGPGLGGGTGLGTPGHRPPLPRFHGAVPLRQPRLSSAPTPSGPFPHTPSHGLGLSTPSHSSTTHSSSSSSHDPAHDLLALGIPTIPTVRGTTLSTTAVPEGSSEDGGEDGDDDAIDPALRALPAPPNSAQLIRDTLGRVNHYQAQPQLAAIFGEPLGQIHALLTTNQDLLSHAETRLIVPLHAQLTADHYDQFAASIPGSNGFDALMEQVRQSLEDTPDTIQDVILATRERRASEVLRPFRERIIPIMIDSIKEIFTLVYEQELLNPAERMRLPRDEINSVELAIQEASATGARCTEPEWTDVFTFVRAPIPSQETLEGRWQTRTRVSLNLWMNHLLEGHILRNELEAILADLTDTGQVPRDYRDIAMHEAGSDAVDRDLVYPEPENRRLFADLMARADLGFAAIVETYAPRAALADQIRAQIVALSQVHTPEAPVAAETLTNLPLAELRARLAPLAQAEQARRDQEAARLAQEERARQEAAAQARALREQTARVLGGDTTAESLAAVTDEDLRARLGARYRALQNYDAASQAVRARLDARIVGMTHQDLIPAIQNLLLAEQRRIADAATRAEREAAERARIDGLRNQTAEALRVDPSTLAGLNTENQLRTRLELRLAEHQGFELASRDRINGLYRSIRMEDRRRARQSHTIHIMTFDQLIRAVSAIPARAE